MVPCAPYWLTSHFQVAFASVSKLLLSQNHSYENVFPLQVLSQADQSRFLMKERFCTRIRFETVIWKWLIMLFTIARATGDEAGLSMLIMPDSLTCIHIDLRRMRIINLVILQL